MDGNFYTQLGWLPSVPENFRSLMQEHRAAGVSDGMVLRQLAGYALNLNQLNSLARLIRQGEQEENPLETFRLCVVSNSTTDFIVPALAGTAARYGIRLEVETAPYGQLLQFAEGAAGLESGADAAAGFDAILIALDGYGLPGITGQLNVQDADAALDSALSYLDGIRAGLAERFGAPCLLQTLGQPPETIFGSYESSVAQSYRQFVGRYNAAVAERAAESADLVLDVAALAATVGSSNWFDPVQHNIGKLPFDQLFVPLYADHVCRIIAASRGKARRCLVLDLDNTLWGGVIGDDGLEGIRVGQGDPVGEAYLNVQATALALRARGIVLAVCSKNEDDTARMPFRKHPDMLLSEDHIAVFQANWTDKAANIRVIAEELKLGLESLVFLDDNPVERDQVRSNLPQVAVPELPDDPSLYSRALLAAGYFESISFTTDDQKRVDDYQASAKRVAVQKSSANMGEFLQTLEMRASLRPFDELGLKRVAQLINKSNQFNLTTHRYNETEVRSMMEDAEVRTWQVRLSDCFGDNGMISVIICRPEGQNWSIDTWLMSCRVIGRKVEELVLQDIVSQARAASVEKIVGSYLPTARNGLVREHYSKLGFSKVAELDDGATTWELIVADYNDVELPIMVDD